MKTIVKSFFSVVACFLFATAMNAQTVVLKPKHDTYVVCTSKSTKSFGSEKLLKSINKTTDAYKKLETFIQFEISKKNFGSIDKLQKATFRIYETGQGLKEKKQFSLHYISENNWDSSLTGLDRAELKLNASPVSKGIKTFTKEENAPGTWYEVDVTQFVKNSTKRSISFRILNKGGEDDAEALLFVSSENKENAPELVLEF
ncbi:MAG: DNRLRE domain-containing protein [Paludibacter sp.]|nr:DNRLRE domain-containing protein [Paludibacter sp.]